MKNLKNHRRSRLWTPVIFFGRVLWQHAEGSLASGGGVADGSPVQITSLGHSEEEVHQEGLQEQMVSELGAEDCLWVQLDEAVEGL